MLAINDTVKNYHEDFNGGTVIDEEDLPVMSEELPDSLKELFGTIVAE